MAFLKIISQNKVVYKYIVTECITDFSDTRKRKNCLYLTRALNVYLNEKH